jgi:CRP/FNR family transcriptional regulator, cyclic AMP receptor protein
MGTIVENKCMKTPVNKFHDAVFLIIGERSCPFYSVGEELKVENFSLSVSSYKPGCLHLAQKIAKIVTTKDSISGFPKNDSQKPHFDCGGCEGLIHFEYKKEKEFATLQMKLLKETEARRRRKRLSQYFGELRKLKIFRPLDDHSLSDLTLLLEFKTILVDKVIIKKGAPGINLYIILKGLVAVIGDDGSTLGEIGTGEIFGEMSLLTGEPVTHSIHTLGVTHVAMLSVKNFRDVLKKHPILQLFLLKILVDRAQTMTLRSGNITSGMTGELAEVNVVDLFQLINSSQKTGMIELTLKNGKAVVVFKEGEIIYARFLKLRHKDAVYALMGAKNGRFSYTRGIPKELEKIPTIGGFMAIMMEGVQRIDERQT